VVWTKKMKDANLPHKRINLSPLMESRKKMVSTKSGPKNSKVANICDKRMNSSPCCEEVKMVQANSLVDKLKAST